jgi:hypothetical protein
MIRVMTTTASENTRRQPAATTTCTHSRLVDHVLTKEGNKTGQLVCVECSAVFLDPTFQKAAS